MKPEGNSHSWKMLVNAELMNFRMELHVPHDSLYQSGSCANVATQVSDTFNQCIIPLHKPSRLQSGVTRCYDEHEACDGGYGLVFDRTKGL